MDDAARRACEIIGLMTSHPETEPLSDLAYHILHYGIAVALREAALAEAAKHADCCVDREERDALATRLERVEAAYRKRCDDYRSVVTILLECDHGDEDMCGCRDRAQEHLARFSRTPIAAALTPDATTEGT